MFSLIPKDTGFFELFEQSAKNVHQGATELIDLLEHYDNIAERAKRMKDIEHAGDTITHETIDRLNRTFLTPLDREDIHELVCRLDDIIDLVDGAVTRMSLYAITSIEKHAIELARCLQHACAVLVDAMPLLRDMKNSKAILQKCIDIHTQENEADRILHHALASLFESSMAPLDVIKWKDIIEMLEAATDRCEDVANVLEAVVIKNA